MFVLSNGFCTKKVFYPKKNSAGMAMFLTRKFMEVHYIERFYPQGHCVCLFLFLRVIFQKFIILKRFYSEGSSFEITNYRNNDISELWTFRKMIVRGTVNMATGILLFEINIAKNKRKVRRNIDLHPERKMDMCVVTFSLWFSQD